MSHESGALASKHADRDYWNVRSDHHVDRRVPAGDHAFATESFHAQRAVTEPDRKQGTLAPSSMVSSPQSGSVNALHAQRTVKEPETRAKYTADRSAVEEVKAPRAFSGSVTVSRGLSHSAGYYAWQLRIRTRQYREAHHYARVLERYIRARRHPTPTRMLSSSSGGSVENAICVTFGNYCSQAVSVARCESELNVGASNGQYLGLFQMGEYARSRYGHSWDAWGQARAAYRYFRDSGYSWAPWTCQP